MVLRQKSFGQSFRTPTFNGALSDFIAAEQFTALSADNAIYEFTFDANIMYFGVFRRSGTFGGTDNFAIYLDTDSRNTLTSGNGSVTGANWIQNNRCGSLQNSNRPQRWFV